MIVFIGIFQTGNGIECVEKGTRGEAVDSLGREIRHTTKWNKSTWLEMGSLDERDGLVHRDCHTYTQLLARTSAQPHVYQVEDRKAIKARNLIGRVGRWAPHPRPSIYIVV